MNYSKLKFGTIVTDGLSENKMIWLGELKYIEGIDEYKYLVADEEGIYFINDEGNFYGAEDFKELKIKKNRKKGELK